MDQPVLRTSAEVTLADRVDAASSIHDFLMLLGMDMDDPNLKNTPNRVVKMYSEELLVGYNMEAPALTCFPTKGVGNEHVIVTGIDVDSTCAHHLMPISGYAAVSAFFLEDEKGDTYLPGLSKYARVVELYSRRLQMQEALTSQIASHLLNETHAVWVGVHIRAEHYCMKHRGVRLHNSETVTTKFYRKKYDIDAADSMDPRVEHYENHGGYFISVERSEELKRSFLDEVNRK